MAANPADFEKPRTHTVGGIRFDFRRRGEKTTPSDRTIALIKARLAGKASVLIRVKETVVQAALNALNDDELLKVEATRTTWWWRNPRRATSKRAPPRCFLPTQGQAQEARHRDEKDDLHPAFMTWKRR